MKNIKFIPLIYLLTSFIFSNNYNIVGTVIDYETKKPLQNVNIFVKDTNFGTTTTDEGYFQLILTDLEQSVFYVSIQIIGYDDKNIYVDSINQNINFGQILLKSKSIKLEASKIHSHDDKSKQISDIKIDGLELQENLKTNIASTLANHPNIGINSYGTVTSKPSLRGFSGDRFLLTKDGSETGDLSQSAIDHVITLDMAEVESIDIIRGPKSLLFGANAIGGVVNTKLISHPSIRVKKFFQKYLIGNESYNNGIYGNMMLYIPIWNNQLNLYLSDRKTDNESTPIRELENTQSQTKNYKIGFNNYFDGGYINVSFENFNMDYGIPPNTGGHIFGVDILLNKKTSEFNFHKDYLNTSNQLDINYSFVDYIHLELVQDTTNRNLFDIFDDDDYHLALAKETHNFQIEVNSKQSTFGFEYNKKHFFPYGYYLTPQTNESQVSIYGFSEMNLVNSNMDILSSFRLGYLEVNPNNVDQLQYLNLDSAEVKKRNFSTISFSTGMIKKFNKFEFNSWIMHTMRPPRVEELYSDGPHLGTYAYEIGNPTLKTEKIYGIENSLKFHDEIIDFSIVTFYNYSPYFFEITQMGFCEEAIDWDPLSGTSHPCAGSDFIDWGSGEFGFLYKYNSRGSKASLTGLEFNLNFKLERFNIAYNFSLVHGYNHTLKLPLSYMNPIKQLLSFNYKNSNSNYKLRFSKIEAQNRLGEFETYTPGSFLTDIVLSHNYKRYNFTLQFNNIFNETYYNHLSRIKDITPEPGRNITIILKTYI